MTQGTTSDVRHPASLASLFLVFRFGFIGPSSGSRLPIRIASPSSFAGTAELHATPQILNRDGGIRKKIVLGIASDDDASAGKAQILLLPVPSDLGREFGEHYEILAGKPKMGSDRRSQEALDAVHTSRDLDLLDDGPLWIDQDGSHAGRRLGRDHLLQGVTSRAQFCGVSK